MTVTVRVHGKRGRGRPKKTSLKIVWVAPTSPKKKRGRPPKQREDEPKKAAHSPKAPFYPYGKKLRERLRDKVAKETLTAEARELAKWSVNKMYPQTELGERILTSATHLFARIDPRLPSETADIMVSEGYVAAGDAEVRGRAVWLWGKPFGGAKAYKILRWHYLEDVEKIAEFLAAFRNGKSVHKIK